MANEAEFIAKIVLSGGEEEAPPLVGGALQNGGMYLSS